MMVVNIEKTNMDNFTKILFPHGVKKSQLLPIDPIQIFCSDLPKSSNVLLSPESGLISMKKNIDAQVAINRIENKRKSIRKDFLQIRTITIQ